MFAAGFKKLKSIKSHMLILQEYNFSFHTNMQLESHLALVYNKSYKVCLNFAH